jgi:hypothetical protein
LGQPYGLAANGTTGQGHVAIMTAPELIADDAARFLSD